LLQQTIANLVFPKRTFPLKYSLGCFWKEYFLDYTLTREATVMDTVNFVMNKVQEISGIPAINQRLIFGRKQLEGCQPLVYYDIRKEPTLHLVLRLRRGMLYFLKSVLLFCWHIYWFFCNCCSDIIFFFVVLGARNFYEVFNETFEDEEYLPNSKRKGKSKTIPKDGGNTPDSFVIWEAFEAEVLNFIRDIQPNLEAELFLEPLSHGLLMEISNEAEVRSAIHLDCTQVVGLAMQTCLD
jgi:hypothetical protein